MTIDHLVRAHREIELTMGYQRQPVTAGMSYTYRMFTFDLNLIHPAIVRNVQQMKDVMSGRVALPQYWERVVNELLELGARGMKYPPRPGPFWHPNPMSERERVLAGQMLVRWQYATQRYNKDLAVAAQIGPERISRIRHGHCYIMPTELDRLAACFNTDRAGFLQGPPEEETGG